MSKMSDLDIELQEAKMKKVHIEMDVYQYEREDFAEEIADRIIQVIEESEEDMLEVERISATVIAEPGTGRNKIWRSEE